MIDDLNLSALIVTCLRERDHEVSFGAEAEHNHRFEMDQSKEQLAGVLGGVKLVKWEYNSMP